MSDESETRSEGRILIVDDERLTRATLEVLFRDEGFDVLTAANGYEAIARLEEADVDVTITDLRMPSMDGRELHRIARERWPETAIVFVTAYGTVATAVEAMQQGAADYLTKPLRQDELLIRVRRLVQRRREREEIRQLRASVGARHVLGQVIGRSVAMRQLVERALSIADADVSVLIQGETGSGKQVLSRLIHDNSPRSGGPFVIVNCAELNPNLIESELFGHEAGAFTGAVRQRRGRFESASGGTILIDEVDDLPREIQVRLLRFLQDHDFERVGSSRTIRGDVRVLCATKQSLPDLVAAGRFRQDLFYRINAITLTIPPLRERVEDIVPLAESFAQARAALRGATGSVEIEPEAMKVLLAHDWPGNVRELKHAIEHGVTFARGAPIGVAHLPAHLQGKASPPKLLSLHLESREEVSHADVLASCERELLTWALGRSGGNQVRAAKLLGLSRTTLRGRLAALRGDAPQDEVTEDGQDDADE